MAPALTITWLAMSLTSRSRLASASPCFPVPQTLLHCEKKPRSARGGGQDPAPSSAELKSPQPNPVCCSGSAPQLSHPEDPPNAGDGSGALPPPCHPARGCYLGVDGTQQGIGLLQEGGDLQGQLQGLVVLLQGALQPQPPAGGESQR